MRLINTLIYKSANILRQHGVNFNELADARILAMRQEIQRLGQLEFKIEQYPDGSWTAESVNINGIITGGSNSRDISAAMRDAIFTYFSIPPHLCNGELLKAANEPVTLHQWVYV